MSVEIEPLRLLPHTFEVSSDGTWTLKKSNGSTIFVPQRYHVLFQQLTSGSSISQIVQSFRNSESSGRFSSLVRFLSFLYENDLLADRRVIELVESLRADTVWPTSMITAPLARADVFHWPEVPRAQWIGILVSSLMAVSAVLIGFFSLRLSLMPLSWGGLDARTVLFVFLAVFCGGRSIRALVGALAVWCGTGRSQTLSLLIDLSSIHLSAGDISRHRAKLSLIVISGSALLFTLVPILFMRFLNPSSAAMLVAMTWLLLLVDHSPFSKSEWTEWLRALFNYRDRRVSRSQLRFSNTVNLVQILLMISLPIWLIMFVLTIGFLYWPMLEAVAKISASSAPQGMATLAVFGVIQALVFISIGEEAFNATLLRYGRDVRHLRKRWRRKSSADFVGELVATGDMPSRGEIEKLPFLRQIDIKARAKLLEGARVVTLKKGQAACRQGNRDRALYIILSGRFAVAKRGAARAAGATGRKIVAMLEPGAVFGEAAFFFAQPRTADVVAVETARVLKIQHDDETMKIADLDRSNDLQSRVWFLQALVSSSFFKELPSEALDALLLAGRHVSVKAGTKVIMEGELADACYFIVQGKAAVMQNMRLISRLQNGDVFGEIALLNPNVFRTATVVAESDLILMAIDSERFWMLLASHLPLALEIERLAEARVRSDQNQRA